MWPEAAKQLQQLQSQVPKSLMEDDESSSDDSDSDDSHDSLFE